MSAKKHEYGPVTEYHGTIDLPKVLSEGIRGGNPKTRSNRYIPEGMREEDLISYTHPDREMALAYAQDRANRMKLDPKKVGVVGVRGTQLPEAVEHQEPKEGIFGGTNSLVRPGSISPEYLIQASEDKMKPKKKKGVVLIISVGPKMPRKPTDEATPNKEVKKSFSEPMEIAYQLLKDIYNLSSPEMEGHKNDYEEYFNKVVLPQAKNEEHAKRLKFAFNNLQNFYLPYSYQYNEGSSHRDRHNEKDEERRGVYRNLSRLGYGDYGDAWHKTKSSSRGSTHPREYQEQNDVLEQLEEEKLLENTKPENWRSQLPKTKRQRDYLKLPLEAHLEGNLENYAHWLSPSEKQKKLLSASAIGQMTSQGPLAELEYQRQFSDIPLINNVTPTSQLESERVFNELKDDTLFNVGEPMEIAYRLLKDDDKNRTMEDAFDLGQEILPYDKLHDKQKQIVDAMANAPPSYWNDPASGELETEYYSGMFENDRQHFYPDEAFNQYLRYIQHFHDASSKVNELPHEKQVEIMNHYGNFQEKHPLHPAKVALDKMSEEHEDWGGPNPHSDFWQRYNEPQALMEEGGDFSQDFSETYKSNPMDIAYQLLKRNLSPAARKHKLQYDTKYQSSPKRVKYRVELNRERRRRGIYGSGNGKDVSHTEGGKLTLENEHDNRARHFKNRGTLRKVKVKK